MPQQVSPSSSLKIFTGKSEKIKKVGPKTILKWTIGFLILILFLASTSLVAASYLSFKLPLVSKSFQRKVDYFVASVPGIPKTPKQILAKALEDSQNIQTSTEDFDLSVRSGGDLLIAMRIKSKIDTRDLSNVLLQADIQGEIFQGRGSVKLTVSIIEIGDDLYFKLEQTPSIPGYDLSGLVGGWYKINLTEAGSSIGASGLDDEKIRSDVSEKLEETFDFLDENELFKEIRKLSDEKVAGRSSFHLQLVVDSGTLTKFLRELTSESQIDEAEVADTFEKVKFDMWVDKKAFFINKLEIITNLKGYAATSNLKLIPKTESFEAKLSYTLSDINKPIKIQPPKDAQELKSFFELLLKVQPSTSALQESVLGVSTVTSKFGSNILFYERLLHVVTLFPGSI
ncbi:MAG TPA: hypothetical protein VF303_01395 [Candidatus Nanoarchaeia archaeon]